MNIKKYLLNCISDFITSHNLFSKLKHDKRLSVNGLNQSFLSFVSPMIFKNNKKPLLIVTATDDDALSFYNDLKSITTERVFYFPSLGLDPYHYAFINEKVESGRLDVIRNILADEKMILVLSVEALLFNVVPKSAVERYFINLKKGMVISIESLSQLLVQAGYSRVKQVMYPGEFAIRGDICDVYYSALKKPVRIEFFDDEIEKLRAFDASKQISSEILDETVIYPHKEMLFDEDGRRALLEAFNSDEGSDDYKQLISDKVESYSSFEGEHFFISLLYGKFSIADYFTSFDMVMVDPFSIEKQRQMIDGAYRDTFSGTFNHNKIKVEPEKLISDLRVIDKAADHIVYAHYYLQDEDTERINFGVENIPNYSGNLELFKEELSHFLTEGYIVMLYTGTNTQQKRFVSLLSDFDPVSDGYDFKEKGFYILPDSISSGFILKNQKVMIINDLEIFGNNKKFSHHFHSKRTAIIENFIDLNDGDYVVHIHHGIGKFTGIERVKSQGVEKDYISILYRDGDKIFIPIEQLNFIQKYLSADATPPKLDRIGAKGWNKTKEKVKGSVNKLAGQLIELYAYRLKQKGFAFYPDTQWQKEFEAKFPYDETDDQIITIEEVKRDMEDTKPMDRLICGDVGFGKTEVAIRAAFKAVMSGKQVAVLVPTTILCEQHFENVCERLSDYPISIGMLSRFVPVEEQKNVLEKLKTGDIDMVIGTHRLLSKDINFKNLGLLIIDEEHRFGVEHKEKIKNIRKSLDCLSMTATPIPRTLHMSLAKIRDMSVINTPPKERIPVETYVMEFDPEVIERGVKNELERNGQVFFLYNRVKTIYEMKSYLESLVPDARIVVAHGQMQPTTLEDIIHDFIKYKYDILLTTTIIESGIDIPRVNTIFIDSADRFGLAQLYQLRGRVGRSNIKAYAYLLHDPGRVLTSDAMKRLKVISQYSELGSGFKIAMKDLEIRGAGNLLGPEQSGDILAVGFSLYCKLLVEAIKELQEEKGDDNKLIDVTEEENEVFLDLEYTGFIPDTYIADTRQKMEVYKKISGICYRDEVDRLIRMLNDRFGPLPVEMEKLIYLAEIRILCKEMKISEMIEKSNVIEIVFLEHSNIDISKIMTIISKSGGKIYIQGDKPSSLFIRIDDMLELDEKGGIIKSILKDLKEA